MSERELYDRIMDLARRRGYFWPSYEIYGGVSGFYDFGPYGAVLKRRIIDKWRRMIVEAHSDHVVEVETPIIGPSRVYEASGHVESFTDPIVACTSCGRKYRADHLIEEALGRSVEGLPPEDMTRLIRENNIRCPVCGGALGEVKLFNLLFQTQIGPYEGDKGYIRPELAQGIFTAFKRVLEVMRGRLPLGVAQVGRVGRNEISPRQAMMRLREFTIMEMEYFIDPEDSEGSCPYYERVEGERLRIRTYEMRLRGEPPKEYTVRDAVESGVVVHKCLAYWMAVGKRFLNSLGVSDEYMYFEEKGPHEKAHYSTQTFDHLVKVSRWGWVEVAGHSYRGDYDLSRHMRFSGEDLTVFKPYEKPVTMKVRRAFIDKALIGKIYKAEAAKILDEAAKIPEEQLLEAAARGEGITIAGKTIPREAIRIVEREERVPGRRFIPHVVEPSFGVDRIVYVAFEYALKEKAGRTILGLPRDIAPVQAGVVPLVEKEESLREKARALHALLTGKGFYAIYDDSGSIGRRYARMDEIGVPAVFTVDYQTLDDNTVTMRDRDTWRQVRLSFDEAPEALRRFIYDRVDLYELGTPTEAGGVEESEE